MPTDLFISISLIAGHTTNSVQTTEEALKLIRRSLKSKSMNRVEGIHFDGNYPHIFVTFGASVILLLFVCYHFN